MRQTRSATAFERQKQQQTEQSLATEGMASSAKTVKISFQGRFILSKAVQLQSKPMATPSMEEQAAYTAAWTSATSDDSGILPSTEISDGDTIVVRHVRRKKPSSSLPPFPQAGASAAEQSSVPMANVKHEQQPNVYAKKPIDVGIAATLPQEARHIRPRSSSEKIRFPDRKLLSPGTPSPERLPDSKMNQSTRDDVEIQPGDAVLVAHAEIIPQDCIKAVHTPRKEWHQPGARQPPKKRRRTQVQLGSQTQQHLVQQFGIYGELSDLDSKQMKSTATPDTPDTALQSVPSTAMDFALEPAAGIALDAEKGQPSQLSMLPTLGRLHNATEIDEYSLRMSTPKPAPCSHEKPWTPPVQRSTSPSHSVPLWPSQQLLPTARQTHFYYTLDSLSALPPEQPTLPKQDVKDWRSPPTPTGGGLESELTIQSLPLEQHKHETENKYSSHKLLESQSPLLKADQQSHMPFPNKPDLSHANDLAAAMCPGSQLPFDAKSPPTLERTETSQVMPDSDAKPFPKSCTDHKPPIHIEPESQICTFNPMQRPLQDNEEFIQFVEKIKPALREQCAAILPTVGTRQAQRILTLLEVARPPDQTDALFVSGPEAEQLMNTSWNGIIITEGQQALPLQTVQQFLDEFYDDRTKVSVQDPSVVLGTLVASVKEVTIGQVKSRFACSHAHQSEPWNLLELATHVDDGLRPMFLAREDTRLLTKLKIPKSDREARRRTFGPGYKEVEKWALVAQAGALTEPHQDSHGYGTFITVNAGRIGFGWLSQPTPAERAEWCRSPHTYVGDKWRYVVLRPGQTVYFPSGTVHFVFRCAADGHTVAFGGHVLRCSRLVQWVRAMLEEKRHPNITNEDITQSAPGYLKQVARYVRLALQSGDAKAMAKWGGREEIEEFLRLKAQFLATPKNPAVGVITIDEDDKKTKTEHT